MAQRLKVHPETPERRLITQAVAMLQRGGVIAYPTDSSYALGCRLGDKLAQDRIRSLRKLDDRHNFTLMCRDLSDIGIYARVDNPAYRLLRTRTPGPYTFILKATHEVPRRLQNPRRKTIGVRVPDHAVVQALLDLMGEPIMSSTLWLPGDDLPLNDADLIEARIGHALEIIVDGGACVLEPTSVLDLSEGTVVVTRVGRGDVSMFAS